MHEQLLQFIWRYQYFNSQELCVEGGEPLQVISPGEQNTCQGPDFLGASLRIGNIYWAGNVELHVSTSDWVRHAHQDDPNYNNVILHVVWTDDQQDGELVPGGDGRRIPLLVLQHRVPKWLLTRYAGWMKHPGFVACEGLLSGVGQELWSPWKRELLAQRLRRKAAYVETCLQENGGNWEETTWWMLARSFGLRINGEAMEAIARSLPLLMLARHRDEAERLEALLLGQAGLLGGVFQEEYPGYLQSEYRYLRNKYRVKPIHDTVHFLRMRPGNFPTVRLAQLAALMSGSSAWWARIKEAHSTQELRDMLDVVASRYWDDHYTLDRAATSRPKRLGEQMKATIIINACCPLLFAYGQQRGERSCWDKAFRWLEELEGERNSQTTGWARLGVGCAHAADSQALLELKGQYCAGKRCLSCAIGRGLLGRDILPERSGSFREDGQLSNRCDKS